jgi:L,D-transpeptidase YcbB
MRLPEIGAMPARGALRWPALVYAVLAGVVAGGAPGSATAADPAASPVSSQPASETAWMAQVYPPANPGPVWFTARGPRPDVRDALQALRDAGDRGLVPDHYRPDTLAREIDALDVPRADAETILHADRALTATMLRFLSDLRFGRVPPQRLAPHFRTPARDAAFVAQLRDAVADGKLATAIDGAEPAFAVYARLKRLLPHYRALAAEPPIVVPPPASKRSVAVGDRYEGAPALRALLVRVGDLAADAPAAAGDGYTPLLAAAVQRFQARHGLQADGVLGRNTLAALNVPLAARVEQIVLSLERLRWLPDLPSGPLIAINIPSFRLWAFADASDPTQPALSMPVVVGKAVRNETPVFIGTMRYVEFSPYWNVPTSILRDEILPDLAKDPGYLRREDMEVVSTNGDARASDVIDAVGMAALRSGEARLRQRPGPRNPLGGIKFALPNAMDIYLHATPARGLFARSRRDFSHGCIRVGDPEALAEFVLRGRAQWTADAIGEAMTSGVNRTVALPVPVPVIMFYTTAIVDREGSMRFLPDIYDQDRVLAAALRGHGAGPDR